MPQRRLSSLRPGGNRSFSSRSCGHCVGYAVGPAGPASGGGSGGTTTLNFDAGIDVSNAVLGCTYDANGNYTGTVVLARTVDEDTSVVSTTQEWWAAGATAGVAYSQATHGDYGPCAGTGSDNLQIVCKCDDVAGDGSNIVQYVEVYDVNLTGGVVASTQVGIFTDKTMTTVYAPVNPSDCDDLGTQAVTKQGRVELSGTSWSPGPLVQSYTIRVAVIANAGTPPTFTDGFGNTTNLELGEVVTFGIEGDLIDTSTVVTANGGDRVVITFTELGT